MVTSKHRRDNGPLPPSEDYVIAESVDAAAEELSLAPPEGQTPEEAARCLATPPNLNVPSLAAEPDPKPSFALRFSLFELLSAMTFVSVALAAATWLPLQWFVGLTGLCTLVLMLGFALFCEPESRMMKLAWWVLVLTYIVSALVAVGRMLVGLDA